MKKNMTGLPIHNLLLEGWDPIVKIVTNNSGLMALVGGDVEHLLYGPVECETKADIEGMAEAIRTYMEDGME